MTLQIADCRLQIGAGVTVAAVAALLVASPVAAPTGVTFTDVTAAAGITFTHNSGRAGQKFLPETLGAGGAFLDADGDGWPDIVLVNGKDWVPKGRKSLSALYRNNGNGTFTNITAGSGLDVEMYGMGVAVGDYDNDGRPDIYIIPRRKERRALHSGAAWVL
jgi:enediyne biosynthesis protein E4